jgi:hypothetical protein
MELTPETIALLQSSPYGIILLAGIWAYKKLRQILDNIKRLEDRVNAQIRAANNNSRRRR